MSPMDCLLVITLSVFFPAIDHPFFKLFFSFVELFLIYEYHCLFRDRPFNLKGGLRFFVSFRNFFSDNTRVRIYIFLSRKARIFFPEFNISLYDKNTESDYFFFNHQNQNIFYSNKGNQNIFLEKNHNPPPPFKLNGRSLSKCQSEQLNQPN
jgi:hypothetical protein